MQENKENQIVSSELQQIIDCACLFDDVYMNLCFAGQLDCTKELLTPIIQKDDLIIKKVETQKQLRGITGKSVCLDILATDSTGKKYNIEVQRQNKGTSVKRARLNLCMLDSTALKAGQGFEKLPDTYIIFITEKDIYARGQGIYKIESVFLDNKEICDIGFHIIYVNGAYKGKDEIGDLIADLWQTDPDKIKNNTLAKRCKYIKGKDTKTQGGDVMASPLLRKYQKIWEKEGISKGIAQGISKGVCDTARAMLKRKLNVHLIAECTGLPIEQVYSLT